MNKSIAHLGAALIVAMLSASCAAETQIIKVPPEQWKPSLREWQQPCRDMPQENNISPDLYTRKLHEESRVDGRITATFNMLCVTDNYSQAELQKAFEVEGDPVAGLAMVYVELSANYSWCDNPSTRITELRRIGSLMKIETNGVVLSRVPEAFIFAADLADYCLDDFDSFLELRREAFAYGFDDIYHTKRYIE